MNILKQVKETLLDKQVDVEEVGSYIRELNEKDKKELAIWLAEKNKSLDVERVASVLKVVEQDRYKTNQVAFLRLIAQVADSMVALSDIVKDTEKLKRCTEENVRQIEEVLKNIKVVEQSFGKTKLN